MNAVIGVEDDKVNRPLNETSGSHQMEVYSSQSELSDNISVLAVRESRWHHPDAVYKKCSFTNDKANKGKNISNQQMVHSTPSQIHKEGHVPMTKHLMRPRTRIEVPNGPQMAIPLIQTQSWDERGTPMSKGSR
jgi:hypothetical protein